jgi:hypothetical protein
MPGTLYRSRSAARLRDYLADVGIGFVLGAVVAVILWVGTLAWLARG